MIYVVGFAITPAGRVVLVEKTHPSWQKGKLNGLGGKVESSETPGQAMAREFAEETLNKLVRHPLYRADAWTHYATLMGTDWQCLCFVGAMSDEDLMNLPLKNDEHEHVSAYAINALAHARILPNLSWLIPLAVCQETYQLTIVHEAYKGACIDEAKRA